MPETITTLTGFEAKPGLERPAARTSSRSSRTPRARSSRRSTTTSRRRPRSWSASSSSSSSTSGQQNRNGRVVHGQHDQLGQGRQRGVDGTSTAADGDVAAVSPDGDRRSSRSSAAIDLLVAMPEMFGDETPASSASRRWPTRSTTGRRAHRTARRRRSPSPSPSRSRTRCRRSTTSWRGRLRSPPSRPLPDARCAEEPDSTEPSGVVEIILPSGIEVYFQAHPKRLYRIRMHPDTESVEDRDERRRRLARGDVVLDDHRTSSTSPASCTGARRSGVNGVQELVERGYIDLDDDEEVVGRDDPRRHEAEGAAPLAASRQGRQARHLGAQGAGGLGDVAATIVDPEVFPAEEQGYVIGVNRFIHESGFVPLKSEVIVASLIHGFAGRFDLFGQDPRARQDRRPS